MKILLIYPPKYNMISNNLPKYLSLESGYYSPLGIMYVAGYLEKYNKCEVSLIDAQVESLDYDTLELRVKEAMPDVVGVYASTLTLVDVLLTSKLVKKIDPGIHVCIGGPHVSLYAEETLSFDCVDSVIVGEGEEAFAHLVDLLKNGRSQPSHDGVLLKYKSEIRGSKTPAFIKELDAIPLPARHLLPYKKYRSLVSHRPYITNIITSRGCPFNCLYCFDCKTPYRARTPQNVLDEIESCIALGIREYFFFDDTFAVNKERVLEICRRIIDRRMDISWNIRTRVNTVDEEVLMSLKRAGCYLIVYGVESGTTEILKVLRKGTTISQAEKALRLTRQYGIKSIANFMLGSPEETIDHIQRTIDFSIKIKPDYAQFAITVPYPGTDLYSLALEKNLFNGDVWRSYALNPDKGFIPPFWEENFSSEELRDILSMAYRRFYFRPAYIISQLKMITSWKDLMMKSKAALSMFAGTK